jgi:hypothetical protein
MRLEPVRQRARVPAGQHVNRPPGASIDQDGPVDVPAAQREVIDAHNVRRSRDRGLRPGDDEP